MLKFFRHPPKSEDLDKKLVLSGARLRLPKFTQLRHLPTLLSAKERWVLQGAAAFFIIIVAAGLSRLITPHLERVPKPGGVYREALVGSPRFVNPILAGSDVDRDLSRLIYSGLLMYNSKGELTGDLAESFTAEDGGRTLKFILRDNLFFHDGERLEVDDIIFTVKSIQNPAWRSPLWRSFEGIEISSPEPNVILVKTATFTNSFANLFTVGIIPKHIWENADPKEAPLAVWNLKPVGSGPFQFSSFLKSRDGSIRSYQLARFTRYYKGAPYIEELVLYFFPDFEGAVNAVREHTVLGVSFVPERMRGRIPSTGVAVIKADIPRFVGLFFQDRRAPALREKAVRQALSRALDRGAIAALVPDAQPETAPFVEGQIGYARTLLPPAYDLAEAARLLKEAGWKKEGAVWKKDQKPLAVRLTVQDEPIQLTVADALRSAWKKLGVEVTLEAVHKGAFEQGVLRTRAYEVLLFSFVEGRDGDPYSFWHSTQIDHPGLNLSSLRVRGIDIALEQARLATDPEERLDRYLEFQKLFYEEAPGVILYRSPYVYVISKKVRGVDVKNVALPADRFVGVHQWYMRSRLGWR
ncbi:hypothetical protein HYW17_02020 [Candidatus Uhrbacteria bacterium]|nr:hypothetical protein [Candidatus Uhrbacteria bacterium]